MMSKAAYVAYLCPKLQKDYGKVFDTPSEILYAPSRIRVSDYLPKRSGKDMVISYLGSLTLGRHKSLMQIGEFLYGYNSSLRLRVYGRADDDVESELRSAKGIEYRGQIPYTKVVEEIGNSDILIHVESFDPFFKDMILYGFTTKIADSLMSGRCFFVYAPDYVACSEYIYSINPECVANNLQEMMIKLSALLDNPELRSACVENFKRYALLNHHPTVNYKKIKKIISVVTHQNT